MMNTGILPWRIKLAPLLLLLATAFLFLAAPASAQDKKPSSYWDHNGSLMGLIADGDKRTFIYVEPRQGLSVKVGTVLFAGKSTGGSYEGSAYRFKKGLDPIPYSVSGPIENGGKRVVLNGRAPIRDSGGKVTKYVNEKLIFSLSSKKPSSGSGGSGAAGAGRSPIPLDLVQAVRGAYWEEGGASGFVRLLAFEKGFGHLHHEIVLEWIAEPSTPDERSKLVSRLEVKEIPDIWVIGEARFERRGSRHFVVFSATNSRSIEETAVFEIVLTGVGKIKVTRK